MNEASFQKQLAALVLRYDAAMQAPKKEKLAWDDEFTELLRRGNDDQARRALKLLSLHVENAAEV